MQIIQTLLTSFHSCLKQICDKHWVKNVKKYGTDAVPYYFFSYAFFFFFSLYFRGGIQLYFRGQSFGKRQSPRVWGARPHPSEGLRVRLLPQESGLLMAAHMSHKTQVRGTSRLVFRS